MLEILTRIFVNEIHRCSILSLRRTENLQSVPAQPYSLSIGMKTSMIGFKTVASRKFALMECCLYFKGVATFPSCSYKRPTTVVKGVETRKEMNGEGDVTLPSQLEA